ncbi:S-layer homology domain-containing protein [Paenibacillus sp. FSL R7-0210]|uniref:NHL domain-containing protein n=1 Tax=Paenibacillus sp. FSL R7-0210 TaxID=2921676 RepID=UPI0030F6C0BF
MRKKIKQLMACVLVFLLITSLLPEWLGEKAYAADHYIISRVAGTGTNGYSGDGGAATSAQLYRPYGVAVDSSGNVYIADTDTHRIRKVDTTGNINTLAGTGTGGYLGDGGAATSARLKNPYGVAVDSSGNVYIADTFNHRIRKLDRTGTISTLAGTGTGGYSGDGGAATSARLNYPYEVAVDSSGNVYIADTFNHRIRKVDTTGNISTLSGTGTEGYSGDGGAATSAQLNKPYGVAVDSSGNVYIADTINHRIRKVDKTGNISTLSGTGTEGYSGDGGAATSAQLNKPYGVAVDSSGNVYIADTINHRIRKVYTTGNISTLAGTGIGGYSGDGGVATSASLNYPYRVVVDSSGNVYIADYGNSMIRKLAAPAPAHTVSVSAAALTHGVGVEDAITLTVKDELGTTNTAFSGAHNVTISGYVQAPDGSYGSFNRTALTASPNTISVTFANGVATAKLKLTKAAAQTIGLSVAGVATPAANTLSITPVAGSTASMVLTTEVTAPAGNGGAFAQQPVVTLRDAYGNTSVSDSTTVVTVSKKDTGTWMLTGTATATASEGVATFSALGATNASGVTGAQLAFDASGLAQITSAAVTLPAPTPAQTVSAAAAAPAPEVGVDDAITLTVKDALENTDTTFSGAYDVTISGYVQAPDGSYGSFNGTALTASPNTISVTFANGVATANLKLNKAAAQTIGLSAAGVATPAANTLSITPVAGSTASMALTTDVTAPAGNGGAFTRQPVVTLRDAYGNTSVSDSTTVVTVLKKDTGMWTLTGTATATASAGVATFSGLGATNASGITGAQLAFDASGLAQITSAAVTLPAPTPAQTVIAAAAASAPGVGVDDGITLTVKNALENTDTTFSGAYDVTISGYVQAPDGSYGSFNGTALTASPNTISVTFVNGVATANLKLNKAAAQTIGLSVAGVATPAANTLSITPVVGSTASMALTTDVAAPAGNGGAFTQQPVVTLRDAYGNTSVSDNSTIVTVSKKDTGTWTLTGTATATASEGVATFSVLGATNAAGVTGAQLAFDASGLAQITSAAVTLPAPTPAQTVSAAAAAPAPEVGVDDAITLSVKNALENTDTTFSGDHNVTISGYVQAPDGSYGSFNGTALTASPNTISVTFANGVATANLKLNKAAAQTIGLSVADVATPAANTLSITPVAGSASSMELTTDVAAPAGNGGAFAQQPVVTLRDAYGNMSVGDSTTVVTVSKKDTGTWTLTGTATATASEGVATFSGLGATNAAGVTGARLAFDASGLAQITSAAVTLPAPTPAQTVSAAAAAPAPEVGVDDAIMLSVKNALENTDTTFSGAHNVTISGYVQAPDGSYGSFNGTALTASPNTISVTFVNGVATANLKLNKAAAQTIGLSVAGVATPAANTLSITPVAGSTASMALTTDVTAPAGNGGAFAQQPVVTLRDAYGNTSVSDSTTVVTVSKKDTGTWTLTGMATATASAGVASFSGLGVTNAAGVTGARLAFDASGLAQITSQSVTLPWPGVAAPRVESVTTGASHVLLTWSEVYGSVSYAVYQGTASGTYGDAVATVTGLTYDVTGLTNGTTYYFVVKAVNPSGISAASDEVSATPQVPAPGVPVLGPATPGDARISLTWDPVIGSTGYKIFKSTTSGAYGSEEASVSGSVYGYDVMGLTNGTSYYFVIRATNPGGDSTFSNEVSTTPRTVPSAPTGVTAVAGDGQATVSFTTPANGGSDITYYEVTAMPGNITVKGAGSPITVTGLSNEVTYTFTVQAVNSAGSSVASDTSNAVTPRQPSGGTDTSTPSTPSTPTTPSTPSTPSTPTTPSTPSTSSTPNPAPTPGSPEPTVDVFNSSIVNETNLVKTIESKVAEANATIDFTDTQGHWAEKTINIFVQLKLINGYDDGTVRPNNPITRAEFAAMLNRVFNIQAGNNTNVVLKDIDDHWAKEAVENLVAVGVINGYTDGTFKPNQTITREEMVVMLSHIVDLNNVAKDTIKGNFNDLNGAYAASEIIAAAQAGIVSGKGNGRFDPKNNATRAEALQIILNVLELNPQLKTLLDSLNR